MSKRQVVMPEPADPLVPIEYLLGLMGWKSRSTYYNRLRGGEAAFPHPVSVGTRNVMLRKSECDAYQAALIARSQKHPAGPNPTAGESEASAAGNSSHAEASLEARALADLK